MAALEKIIQCSDLCTRLSNGEYTEYAPLQPLAPVPLRHPYFNSCPDLDPAAVDEDVAARLRLRDVAPWWHAAREPDIAADR